MGKWLSYFIDFRLNMITVILLLLTIGSFNIHSYHLPRNAFTRYRLGHSILQQRQQGFGFPLFSHLDDDAVTKTFVIPPPLSSLGCTVEESVCNDDDGYVFVACVSTVGGRWFLAPCHGERRGLVVEQTS